MKIKSCSVRELRENLASLLQKVAAGEQVIITKRRKPIARIIPEVKDQPPPASSAYPLRGSLLGMSQDFDAPVKELWEAFKS